MKEPLHQLGAGIAFTTLASFTSRLKTLRNCDYTHLLYDYSGLAAKKPAEIRQMARLVADTGLRSFALHAPPPSYPARGETAAAILAHHQPILETAALLGVRYVVHHPGWPRDAGNTMRFEAYLRKIGRQRYWETNGEILALLCRAARALGLRITLENGPQGFLADLATRMADIVKLIRAVGMSNLGICLDTGHSNLAPVDLAREIRVSGNLLWDTHFNDNFGLASGRYPEHADCHLPVGIGTIHWLKVIAALKAIRFKGPVVFELIPRIRDFEGTLRINRANWMFLVDLYRTKAKQGGWS